MFARNITHRFPGFLFAFAQIFSLLLPKFFHCFCPNFQLLLTEFREKAMGNSGTAKQWEFREKAMGNSGKSNRKFGQKRCENVGKSNEKIRKAAAYISGKNYCFCPNFPLLLTEFPIAFARISHCFCPNFPLLLPEFFVFNFFFFLGGRAQCPLCPPPRLLRL